MSQATPAVWTPWQPFGLLRKSFDLVITDQTMPDMTGETLVRELRRIRPDIPVILCTGYSPLIDAEHAEHWGLMPFC